MALANFEIGEDTAHLVNIESLGVPEPQWEYRDYAASIPLGDGTVRGQGAPVAVWRWRWLTKAQRAVLRTYCLGKSSSIAIQTKNNEGEYTIYNAVMVWPDQETFDGGRAIDLAIEFRNLEAVP